MIIKVYNKTCFQDWLYFLFYSINFNNEEVEQHFHSSYETIFLQSKVARFRFEQRSSYSKNALHDISFQYGNYHLSKITFTEDFERINYDEMLIKVEYIITKLVYDNIPVEERKKAKEIALNYLVEFENQNYEIYTLTTTSEVTQLKVAPFNTFTFFEAFLIFNQKKGDNFFYVEFGCD